MLFNSFTTFPLPGPPMRAYFPPVRASRTGCAAAAAVSVAPTNALRVPVAAPSRPPETGASTKHAPWDSASAAMDVLVPGSEVVVSMIAMVPGPERSTGTVASTMWAEGRDSTAYGMPARSRSSAVVEIPVAAAAFRATSEGSKPVTSQPARCSVDAIAPPMDPRPTTAMRRVLLMNAPRWGLWGEEECGGRRAGQSR
ncbi:hypothetical protein PJL18_02147 [Paenarthrobacter nicotinovorans]|nr:hypothetical protein [Paenarthrobacter nicotinovorans]